MDTIRRDHYFGLVNKSKLKVSSNTLNNLFKRVCMYEIKSSILGFEDYKKIEIEAFDNFFSIIQFDKEKTISMNIANAKYLQNININLQDNILEQLNCEDIKQLDIYFTMVIQEPIEDSVINLGAPIIINENKKLLGQFIVEDSRLFRMCTIKDISTL